MQACSLPAAPPEPRSLVELQKCNEQKQELWLPESFVCICQAVTTEPYSTVLLGAGCGSWPRSWHHLGPLKPAPVKWTCECCSSGTAMLCSSANSWWWDGIPKCILGASWCYQFWVIIILWEGWRKTSFLPCWIALSSHTSCCNSLLILLCYCCNCAIFHASSKADCCGAPLYRW